MVMTSDMAPALEELTAWKEWGSKQTGSKTKQNKEKIDLKQY